jgi:hypothetical protein
MSEKEPNRTSVEIAIDKTIQPKQFEPIKIHVSIKEDFVWDNKETRGKKLKNYTDMILDDFIKTINAAMEKIGEKDRCIGHVSSVNNSSKNDDKQEDFDEDWGI